MQAPSLVSVHRPPSTALGVVLIDGHQHQTKFWAHNVALRKKKYILGSFWADFYVYYNIGVSVKCRKIPVKC